MAGPVVTSEEYEREYKPRRYEFVTSSMRYHNEKIIQAFQLFIKLTVAIIGGTVYLAASEKPGLADDIKVAIALAAIGAQVAVSIVSVIMICDNLYTLWGFREKESKILGTDASGKLILPKPEFPKAARSERMMVCVVMTACVCVVFLIFCLLLTAVVDTCRLAAVAAVLLVAVWPVSKAIIEHCLRCRCPTASDSPRENVKLGVVPPMVATNRNTPARISLTDTLAVSAMPG